MAKIATKEIIPEELIVALKGVCERVINQSEDKIEAIQQEAQQELFQLREEVKQLKQGNGYWQQQYQQTKQERDRLSHEKSTVEKLFSNAKIEIATSAEKLAGCEQQYQEKEARIEKLRRPNQQIQAIRDP